MPYGQGYTRRRGKYYNRRQYGRRRNMGGYRRSYASAIIPQDYGGIRGAPMDSVGRGFRGNYTRSQAEKKFVDIAAANYAADTTGAVTPLNLANEGSGVSQRIGRKITIKSVQVRGYISHESTTNGVVLTRVMLVWDKQVNGVAATISEILSASTSESFMNLDNRERFVVLKDKHVTLGVRDQTAGLIDKSVSQPINIYKQLPAGSETIFDGTGSGIADVNTGALYLVTIGSAGTGSVLHCATRVRYTDS